VTPLHLQKDADALNDYSQAIKQAPNPAAAIFGRAPPAYDALKNYNASIADHTRLITLGQDKATAFNNRCWARAIVGELDLALSDCNESLQFDPHDPDVLDSRGLVNFKIGIRDNSTDKLPDITIVIDGYVPIIIDPNDESLQATRDDLHKRMVIESIAMDKKGAFLPNVSHKLDTTPAAASGRASR
jgi:tetratricopeptide (TPR) repeat protein